MADPALLRFSFGCTNRSSSHQGKPVVATVLAVNYTAATVLVQKLGWNIGNRFQLCPECAKHWSPPRYP